MILVGPRDRRIEANVSGSPSAACALEPAFIDRLVLGRRRRPGYDLDLVRVKPVLPNDVLLDPLRPYHHGPGDLACRAIHGFTARKLLDRPELGIVQMRKIVWIVDGRHGTEDEWLRRKMQHAAPQALVKAV